MKTHSQHNLIHYLLGLGLMAAVAITSQAQTQTFKLVADDYAAEDHFGSAVSVSGDLGLVAAPGDDNGDASGLVYVFDVNTGQRLRKLLPDVEADFGSAVAIDGNHAVITFDGHNDGAAYVFDATTGQQLHKLGPADGTVEKLFGASVALSGNIAVVGAPNDSDNGEASGSAYLFDISTGQQTFKLLAADGAFHDRFGQSVAISGDRVIVGAEGKDMGAGVAYIFDVTTGQQLAKLVASDRAPGRQFGGAVAMDGTKAVVGCRSDDSRGPLSGSAYVFDATTGQQLFKLTAADAGPVDFFGWAVAVNGNLALIGAPISDGGSEMGSAYLFDVTTGQQLAKVLAGDGASGDSFGGSVAISGNTALIGAGGDTLGTDPDTVFAAGSAYVFELPEFKSETRKLVAEDYAQDALFGQSVGLNGHLALIGAGGDTENGAYSGAAYLFDTSPSQQLLKLLPDDGAAEDFFGGSVALSQNIALIGAPGDDGIGSAYLFDATTGQQLRKLQPDDGAPYEHFGTSAALSGNTAVVGAVGQADFAGAAYVFDVSTGRQRVKLLPNDGEAFDSFSQSVAIAGNIAVVGAPIKADGAGAAYLFNASTGQQLFKLVLPNSAPGDVFGMSVAIDGNVVVVGALGYDGDAGANSGAAFLFDVTTGQQIAKLQPQDAEEYGTFGEGVAISGNTVVVGATANGAAGSSHLASAYVFDVTTGQQLAKLVHSDREQNDGFGTAIALDGNTAVLGAVLDSHSGVILAGSAYVFENLRPLPPTIVVQPEDQSLNEGEDATLSVMAEGTKPFHYQWLFDGAEITAATNKDLMLTSVQEGDEGPYLVVVTNALGSVTSAPALLIVNQFPIADASATELFWTSPNGIDATVVLDGSRSSDPDGDELEYLWLTGSTPIGTGMVEVVTLPVGVHAVDLVVDDGLAQDTDGISVSVLTAAQSVERLESLVGESDLTDTQQMLASLGAALASIDRGSWISAVNQLHAFQNKLRAQVAPDDAELAAELTQLAAQVIDALGGDSTLRGSGKIRSLKRPADGQIQLRIEAAAGYIYIVEASTDLVTWEAVGTTTLQADGTFEFEQVEGAHHPQCFYRVVTP